MAIISSLSFIACIVIVAILLHQFSKKKKIDEIVLEPSFPSQKESDLNREIIRLKSHVENIESKNQSLHDQLLSAERASHDKEKAYALELSRKIREEKDKEFQNILIQKEKEFLEKLESSRRQTRSVNFGNHAQRSVLPILGASSQGMSSKDIRWLGDTVDFVCFKGLDSDADEIEIIFVDAKTSKSVKEIIENKDKWSTHKSYNPAYKFLNDRQKKLLSAVKNGRVSFQIWMTDEEGSFCMFESDKHCSF